MSDDRRHQDWLREEHRREDDRHDWLREQDRRDDLRHDWLQEERERAAKELEARTQESPVLSTKPFTPTEGRSDLFTTESNSGVGKVVLATGVLLTAAWFFGWLKDKQD